MAWRQNCVTRLTGSVKNGPNSVPRLGVGTLFRTLASVSEYPSKPAMSLQVPLVSPSVSGQFAGLTARHSKPPTLFPHPNAHASTGSTVNRASLTIVKDPDHEAIC